MLTAAAGPAVAQSEAGAPRTPTVTRWVMTFSDLENRLDTAARTGDAEGLEHLLAADFELRNAARPGVPVARAEFVEQLLSKPRPAAQIEQMAVHDFGAMAIVSFELRRGADSAPVFVVDAWGKTGAEWQLRVRYAGPGGAQAAESDVPKPDTRSNLPKKY